MKPDFVSTSGAMAPRERQHVERLPVIGLRPHAPVQARHRLHVVIEDVRAGVEHARHGVEIAAEIGRQHFDARLGQRAPHFAHRLGEVRASRRRPDRRDSRW